MSLHHTNRCRPPDNQYRIQIFQADHDGQFVTGPEAQELSDWLEGQRRDGYHLRSLQPVANDAGVYMVATMESGAPAAPGFSDPVR